MVVCEESKTRRSLPSGMEILLEGPVATDTRNSPLLSLMGSGEVRNEVTDRLVRYYASNSASTDTR